MTNTFQTIPEQEEVVFEQKSQIVSASAGSGKTTVMIRKVVEHIKAKDCHVDQVLILTYTTAAAQEMKKKLNKKKLLNYEPNILISVKSSKCWNLMFI